MTDEQKSNLKSLIADYANAFAAYDEQIGHGLSIKQERLAKERAERTKATLDAYIETL